MLVSAWSTIHSHFCPDVSRQHLCCPPLGQDLWGPPCSRNLRPLCAYTLCCACAGLHSLALLGSTHMAGVCDVQCPVICAMTARGPHRASGRHISLGAHGDSGPSFTVWLSGAQDTEGLFCFCSGQGWKPALTGRAFAVLLLPTAGPSVLRLHVLTSARSPGSPLPPILAPLSTPAGSQGD